MKITPATHYVHVQLYFPDESDTTKIALPANVTTLTPSVEQRARVECLGIGPDVTVCKPGDFLLLNAIAKDTLLPVTKDPPTGLIHDSLVMAIILDDAQHVH